MNVCKNISDFFNVLIYLDQPNPKRKGIYFMKNENELLNCYILRQNDILDVDTEEELLNSLLKEGIESCVLIEDVTNKEMDKMLSVCFKKYYMIRVTITKWHSQIDNFLFLPDQSFDELTIVCGKNVLTNEQYLNKKELVGDIREACEDDEKWNLMWENNRKSYYEIYEELYPYSKVKILKPNDLPITK